MLILYIMAHFPATICFGFGAYWILLVVTLYNIAHLIAAMLIFWCTHEMLCLAYYTVTRLGVLSMEKDLIQTASKSSFDGDDQLMVHSVFEF